MTGPKNAFSDIRTRPAEGRSRAKAQGKQIGPTLCPYPGAADITSTNIPARSNCNFGHYFFVNGLFKGGLTVLFLIAFLGDNWVGRHRWGTIGIAFLVGVGILFPLCLLMRKEDW